MQEKPRKKEKGKKLWFRVVRHLLPSIARGYFRLVELTSKILVLNGEYEEEVCKKGPFAVAGFHGKALFLLQYLRRYGGVTMVSKSWDGELIDATVRKWGYVTCRGSSSRGGKEALRDMIRLAKENNCPTGLAVDAPRGPAGIVKMGIVILGRETGQPVLPVTTWTTRHLQFGSWDRMIVPLPFSTIVVAFGRPTIVPQGLEPEDYERLRQEIEHHLTVAATDAEKKVMELKGKRPEVGLSPIPTETQTLHN